MPKQSINAFISAHGNDSSVEFIFLFVDFRRAKRVSKGKPLKLTTGQIFPSPNRVIVALMKNGAHGDYAVESIDAGTQRVLAVDQPDVQGLFRSFQWERAGRPMPPASIRATTTVDMQTHHSLAAKLGLV